MEHFTDAELYKLIQQEKREMRLENAKRRRSKVITVKEKIPEYFKFDEAHASLKHVLKTNKMVNDIVASIPNIEAQLEGLIGSINQYIYDNISDNNFNYSISGSSAWNNIFGSSEVLLSEYEKSAIHKYNSRDFVYIIKNIKQASINTDDIISYLNQLIINLNQYLSTIPIQDPEKYYRVKLNTESKSKFLFKDAILFNVELDVSDVAFDSIPLPKVDVKHSNQQPQPPINVFSPSVLLGLSQSQLQAPSQTPLAAPKASKTPRPRKTVKQEAIELEQERKELEKVRQALANSRSARAAAREAKKGGNPFSTFRIFTFEFNIYDDSDPLITQKDNLLKNYHELILDTHYLNIYGLYIFNHIAKIRYFITRGNYSAFKIREYIFDKLVLIPEYKTEALFDIVRVYELTFKDLDIPNKYLYDSLQKLAMLSIPDIETFVNNMEANIIECLRPFINKTLININNDIHKIKFHDSFNNEIADKFGIFVAGGDAIRRFKYDATVTKDIDSKIYVPAEIPLEKTDIGKTNYTKIDTCITHNLFKLLSLLLEGDNENIKYIFAPINSPDKITYTNSDNYSASFTLISEEQNNFRFRKLAKSIFPVDLYSLDYRCSIEFKYPITYTDPVTNATITRIHTYKNNYDIAFLDVVLENKGSTNYYKEYAVISDNNLPISSLEFLLYDLRTTYNTDTSSLLRFLGNKSDKDYKRYIELLKIYYKNKYDNPPIYRIDENKHIFFNLPQQIKKNSILNEIKDYNIDDHNKYYKTFNELYQDKVKRNLKKIIFDYTIEPKRTGGAFRNLKKDDDYTIYEAFKNHPEYYPSIYSTSIEKEETKSSIDTVNNQLQYIYKIMKPPNQIKSRTPDNLKSIYKFITKKHKKLFILK